MGKRWTRRRAGDQWGVTEGAGAPASPWTTVVPALKQDPTTAIDSASYGAVSSVTLKDQDPGNIHPDPPDCPMWDWEIDNTFDHQANMQVVLQLKVASTPDQAYILYLGVYDDTVAADHGVYGAIGCTTGATGYRKMGTTPAMGDAAASIVANGGMLSVCINIDGDNDKCRDLLVRSMSNTGPAYGRQAAAQDASAWAGDKLRGFFAIGSHNASRTGGVFAGIELRYIVIPEFS